MPEFLNGIGVKGRSLSPSITLYVVVRSISVKMKNKLAMKGRFF
jgi:hypothetical protein